ncbi:hypothetical protein BKA69DRAFT_1038877 [Paraphysoderma sedebokerense]|nr:hypothetical protein BKA69DRAFT_1038877 [Paraphysoderma sedebokerense]
MAIVCEALFKLLCRQRNGWAWLLSLKRCRFRLASFKFALPKIFAMEHQGITLSESTDNIDGPGTRLKLNVNFDVIDPDKVPVLENPVKNPVWKVFVFSFSTACSWFAFNTERLVLELPNKTHTIAITFACYALASILSAFISKSWLKVTIGFAAFWITSCAIITFLADYPDIHTVTIPMSGFAFGHLFTAAPLYLSRFSACSGKKIWKLVSIFTACITVAYVFGVLSWNLSPADAEPVYFGDSPLTPRPIAFWLVLILIAATFASVCVLIVFPLPPIPNYGNTPAEQYESYRTYFNSRPRMLIDIIRNKNFAVNIPLIVGSGLLLGLQFGLANVKRNVKAENSAPDSVQVGLIILNLVITLIENPITGMVNTGLITSFHESNLLAASGIFRTFQGICAVVGYFMAYGGGLDLSILGVETAVIAILVGGAHYSVKRLTGNVQVNYRRGV